MKPETQAALLEMAGHVAQSLVADALRAMASGVSPVAITVHAMPERKLLPPAKRKYTRRANTAKTVRRPWTAAQRKKFAATMAAKKTQASGRARVAAAAIPPLARPVGRPRAETRVCACSHKASDHVDYTGGCTNGRCQCATFQ